MTESVFMHFRFMKTPMWPIKFFTCLLLFLSVPIPNLQAGSDPFRDYEVKAVFLYNLTHFISWPVNKFNGPDTPITICILGKNPVTVLLDKIVQGETVNGRQIAIKQITNICNCCPCHILFISSSLKEKLPQIFNTIHAYGLLTVGEVGGFAHQGGVINLNQKQKRVYVEINVQAAKKAGLKISPKLLKVAKIVGTPRSSNHTKERM